MTITKLINRLDRVNDLIRRKATGNPKQFAAKLNLSESAFYEHLRELRALGMPIQYCNHGQFYYFNKEVEVKVIIGKQLI